VPVPVATVHPNHQPHSPRPLHDERQHQRHAITAHFLTALEDVVWRHRALAGHPEHADLHAELVTAEVAHQLEVTRQALSRHPAVR
jgi:hypothetical protein